MTVASTMGQPGTRNCVSCGRSIGWDANVCPYCGHDYRMRMMPPPPEKSSRASVAGILILVAGLLAVINGAVYLALSASIDTLGIDLTGSNITETEFEQIMIVLGIVSIVLGGVAVLGGILGIQRRHFGWVIVGGVTGLFGIGFVIGAILALVGLVLAAMSKDEFRGPGQQVSPPFEVR